MADRVYPTDRGYKPAAAGSSYRSADLPSAANKQHQQQTAYTVPMNGVYNGPPTYPYDEPYRRRRNPCCCCLIWVSAIIITILVILCIAAVVLYFVLQPRVPKFSIQDVRVSKFNVTSQPSTRGTVATPSDAPYLNSNLLFTISARNPNKKLGIDYDDALVYLSYESTEIGTSAIVPFYQGHKNTTKLAVKIQGQDRPLGKKVGSDLRSSLSQRSGIWLETEIVTHARIKVGKWKAPKVKLRVKCNVEMTAPSSGTARILSSRCKVKVFHF